MAVTRASSNSARARVILHGWRSSNGLMPNKPLRKNPRKKRKRKARSPSQNHSSKGLKPSSSHPKSQRLKFPLRKRKNPLRHRQKNRSPKSGDGSVGNQIRAEISVAAVRA